jgi:ABC-type glycerol-3-phosphate transport system substrate-binding protein
MRKILTSAMVAGAALMVAACGGDTEAGDYLDG